MLKLFIKRPISQRRSFSRTSTFQNHQAEIWKKHQEALENIRKQFGNPLESLKSAESAESLESAGAPTFLPTNEPINLKKHKAEQEQKQSGLWKRLQENASGPSDGIPIYYGLVLLSFLGFLHARSRARDERMRALEITEVVGGHREVLAVQGPWHIQAYALLPFRFISRVWGKLCNVTIPTSLRSVIFGAYANAFGVDMSEALDDYAAYPTLTEFFLRRLKPNARTIDSSAIISPCDGTVLSFGLVTDRRIEQVKGFTYSLDHFLGNSHHPISKTDETAGSLLVDKELVKSSHAEEVASIDDFAQINGLAYSVSALTGASEEDLHPLTDSKLWFAVIYLSPGDYHRFHSPTDWIIQARRHFAGDLFSVSPWIVERLKNLFVLNERVAVLGRWRHGFMSMTAVGATNVGSISLTFDEELQTNRSAIKSYRESREWHAPGTFTEKTFASPVGGIATRRGVELGAFRLGSTIVLVFEAPKEFEFTLQHNQKIRVGDAVGRLPQPIDEQPVVEPEKSGWLSWLW